MEADQVQFTAEEQTKIDEFLAKYGNDVKAKDKYGEALLHKAVNSFVMIRNLAVIKFLVSQGSDVRAKNKNGETPLHEAVGCYDGSLALELVKFLVSRGADVNAKDKRGKTPLHNVTDKGRHIDIAKFLISEGADVSNDLCDLLHMAANHGDTELIKFLMSQVADVNTKDQYGRTPLHEVASWNNEMTGRDFVDWENGEARKIWDHTELAIELANLLISRGAKVNIKDNGGKTPLHRAICNLEMVKLLISKGAKVNAKDKTDRTPLHSGTAYTERVKILVSTGANVNAKDRNGDTPLHRSVSVIETVKFLVSAGADVNAKNGCGRTPLHQAMTSQWVATKTIQFLVSVGADVNAKDNGGETPLYCGSICICDEDGSCNDPEARCLREDDADVAKILVSAGADVNAKTNYFKRTPLHCAVEDGYIKTVKFLVSAGADVDAKDKDGKTPLDLAKERGDRGETHDYWRHMKTKSIKIVDYLSNLGAKTPPMEANQAQFTPEEQEEIDRFVEKYWRDVTVVDEEGMTALHHAVRGDYNIAVIKYLVFRGAGVNATCDSDWYYGGWLPLHFAVEKNIETVKFLVSSGADVNAKNDCGQSPLHWAVNIDIAKFLISNRADVNARSDIGYTPLHFAENIEIAEFLVANGADVNAQGQNGETPLHRYADRHISIKNGDSIDENRETVDMKKIKGLVKLGADINVKSGNGGTPLHIAVWTRRSTEFLKCLISLGADVDAKDENGATPLDWAKSWKQKFTERKDNNTWVIEYLESIGAQSGSDVP